MIVSAAEASLYCEVSENSSKVSLNDIEFLNTLTVVPEAATSITSVANTCVTVVENKLKKSSLPYNIKFSPANIPSLFL